MKYILFIALLLPSFIWAQENSQKKNSIQIINGIGVGSNIFGISLEEHLIDCTNCTKSSKPGINYRFGFDYQRQLIGGLSMKIGSRFSTWNLKDVLTANYDYIICCIEDCNYPQKEQQLRQYYAEMPLALQYKFGQNKLQFYVEMGVNPMLSISNHAFSTDNNPFSFAVQVGAGLSYQLSDNCSLFGQLSSRVQTKETQNMNISYGHLYEISLEVGAGFYF